MPPPEKIHRNKAIIALVICGFGLRETSRILNVDYGNLRRFLQRDTAKYQGEIMASITNYMLAKPKVATTNNKEE